MNKKIFLLHGDNAVSTYTEEGVKACIKQGYNNVSAIEYDEQTDVVDLVREVLYSASGSLDTCVITEKDYNEILKASK